MSQTNESYFLTNYVEWNEVGIKGGRQHYITGFISTDEIDRSKDIVSKEAMVDMVAQLKCGNVKLDVEHSTFTGDVDIPVGKILDAKLVEHEGKSKIWIKAVINQSHSKFNEVWKSIQDGFLDAFSIAYQVKDCMQNVVDETEVTILKSLELLNVAITGNPVNKGATMTSSFMKSIKGTLMEEINMDAKLKDEPVQPEAQPQEEVKEEQQPQEEVTKEEQPPENATIVEEPEAVVEPTINPLDEIKSLKKELAQLKAMVEKPKMKSVISETPKPTAPEVTINPLDTL